MDAQTLDQNAADQAQVVSPVKLAHVVFRTSRYDEMRAWYKAVLGATASYENAFLSFLTYEEEHHRVAIVNVPELAEQDGKQAGTHHTAFTYATLGDLLTTYERLRNMGVKPIFVINHGPTTSIYYADPDGNQLEFQIDNYDNIEDATAFFYSPAFAENPIGVEFDPEDLLRRWRAGEPEEKLKERPNAGPKDLSDVKLR